MLASVSPFRPAFRSPAPVDVPDLGASTAELAWLGRSVEEAQRAEAEAAGLGAEGADVVTLTPGAVATAAALQAFVEACAGVEGDVVGSITGAFGTWSETPAFGPPARLLCLRGGGEVTEARLAAATEVAIEVEGQTWDLELLDVPGGRKVSLPVSAAQVVSRARWPGVIWANLLGLGPALLGALPGRRAFAPARLAWAALRAGTVEPEAVGRQLVRRGAGVRVHPSAVVEASWLMDGAIVDAGAIVRHSIIGPGATVEAQGLVLGSVLGPGARLQRRGFVTYGVLDGDAVCGGTLQLGYVGPRAQLKVGAILLDQALGGPVRARIDGQLVSVPLDMLGAGLGVEAVVGGGVMVAAGRLIPARVQVVAGAGQVLLRPGVDGPGRYQVQDGALRHC